MAVFKIEVDIDWVEEGGSIDQAIKDEIASTIIKTVSEKAVREIETKVDNMVEKTVLEEINSKLAELLQDFMNRPRTITDRYGDIKKTGVSVMDLLKEQCDNFIEGFVDYSGNPVSNPSYGKKKRRIDYIVEKSIDYEMKRSIERAAGEIKTGLQSYIDKTLKEQIGENIAKAIGLEKIAAKI